MKSSIKKIWLLWLVLLCGIWIISFVTKAIEITPHKIPDWVTQHSTVLHSLYLWDRGDGLTGAWLRVLSWRESLNVLNWFAAWTWTKTKNSIWKLVVVGWWIDNQVYWNGAAVGWWEENYATSNSVIAWWVYYKAENWWVIVGGWWTRGKTEASNKWVILGWSRWYASGWVVLWWIGNESQAGSIVLWEDSKWKAWSFAWNAQPDENSAQVTATNWLLIWTNASLANIQLVVTGAVKIWSSNRPRLWEIKLASNDECISAHDGTSYMALGWASANGECTNNGSCLYSWVYLQDWDTMTWYDVFYAIYPESCNSHKITNIKCSGWVIVGMGNHKYLYCYDVDPRDPTYWW
jgi:hypothetical protein